ncbi:unnamed protein product [Mytilus coruscus]|uniref:PDZ domain-containing protein n=1 Tax=Mytilus coruscus TaxID=42192 RepID=A0A6J8B6J2_MYTCO|nr:unnamed protein product [Mytilus coruscus]
MWRFSILYILVIILSFGIVQCQECGRQPDVAVIVVASVFSTLAVVLLIFGIIFFILWKRRRDLLKPQSTPIKKNRLVEERDSASPDVGHTNPGFNDSDIPADISLAEEGVGGYIQCQEYTSPAKKKSPKLSSGEGPSNKPWSSLPTSDIPPGLQRNGSVGSFDDTFFGVDPEVSSVWLQSQDFIGLGFNIAGSMRDGIFVSQVHNRGPAVESGQFKVGDRILSVTISFENMVYEDALTILSYASPYPVRVTLQKEKLVRKDRRVSESPSTLSHPLYRSQSMDTLKKIRKDSTLMPQRSFSEMRPEKKKENHQRSSAIASFSAKGEAFPTIQEHGSKKDLKLTNGGDVFKETVVTVEREPTNVNIPSVTVNMVDGNEKHDTSNATAFAANLFDKLNEQDKLDMLRLSYEDPNDDSNNSKVVISSAETSFTETAKSVGSLDLDAVVVSKSAPIKPERRKKSRSSGSSVSSSDTSISPRVSSLQSPDSEVVQEVFTDAGVQLSESQPKSSVFIDEVSEEIITPAIKDRNISVMSDKIEFSDVDITEKNDTSRSSLDIGSLTLVDYSLSDMESTLRPTTPENRNIVDEELITPEQSKKDSSGQSLSNMIAFKGTPTENGENSSIGSDVCNDTVIKASNSSSSLSSSGDEKNESKLQNTSEVDFNVTASNPSLFSTPYPSRNTKEKISGMSYDISMNELNDIETQMSQKSKQGKDLQKRGIAFEVRDDFTTGSVRTVAVDSKSPSVLRTMSCFDKIGNLEQFENTMQMTRTGSFTKNVKKDTTDSSLEWSGKRLVRSGSFSDIPQDDSVKDWRDHNVIDDSDTINSSTNEDIISSNDSINEDENEQKGLKKSNFFRARENLANLSDNSESLQSLQSLTESSSRSSTPPPPYTANGKDNGLGSSPDSIKLPNNLSTTDVIFNTDSDNNIIPAVKIENKENIRVSVSTSGHDDDTDC